ncbi:MAG: hypothetical protein ACR2PX_09945 [Endozoicomonas sp.]|uniref:hypothetical protein n=1 Tax=Endozoicomonas sp. TaxID=1892382 RepID=UPI003D9BC88B
MNRILNNFSFFGLIVYLTTLSTVSYSDVTNKEEYEASEYSMHSEYSVPAEMSVTLITNAAKTVSFYKVCQNLIHPLNGLLKKHGEGVYRRHWMPEMLAHTVIHTPVAYASHEPEEMCLLLAPVASAGDFVANTVIEQIKKEGIWKSILKYSAAGIVIFHAGHDLDINSFEESKTRANALASFLNAGLLVLTTDGFVGIALDSTLSRQRDDPDDNEEQKLFWQDVCDSWQYFLMDASAGVMSHHLTHKALAHTNVGSIKSEVISLVVIPITTEGMGRIADALNYTGNSIGGTDGLLNYRTVAGGVAFFGAIAYDGAFYLTKKGINKCITGGLSRRDAIDATVDVEKVMEPLVVLVFVSHVDEFPEWIYNMATQTYTENGSTVAITVLAALFSIAISEGLLYQPKHKGLSFAMKTLLTASGAYLYSTYDSVAKDIGYGESLASQNWIWHWVASGVNPVYERAPSFYKLMGVYDSDSGAETQPIENNSPGRLHEYREWAGDSMTRLYYIMTSVFSRSEVPPSSDTGEIKPGPEAATSPLNRLWKKMRIGLVIPLK